MPCSGRSGTGIRCWRCLRHSPGQHDAGGRLFLEVADVRHGVFGERDAGDAGRGRERFRKDHDHRAVGGVGGTVLVGRFGGLGGQLLHGVLAVAFGLVHDLRVGQPDEVHDRAVVGSVAESVPELRGIAELGGSYAGP